MGDLARHMDAALKDLYSREVRDQLKYAADAFYFTSNMSKAKCPACNDLLVARPTQDMYDCQGCGHQFTGAFLGGLGKVKGADIPRRPTVACPECQRQVEELADYLCAQCRFG